MKASRRAGLASSDCIIRSELSPCDDPEGRMGRLRYVIGGLAAAGAAAVTSLSSARSSLPAVGNHDFPTICHWIVSGNDPLAAASAIVAGLAMGFAFWQILQPAPASTPEVEHIVAGHSAAARRDMNDLSGQLHQEGQASEDRDRLTHRLVSGDLAERMETAIEHGTLSDEQCRRLYEMLRTAVSETTQATPAQAEAYAETALRLAQSDNAADRAIAVAAVAGNPIDAGDRLMAEVGAEQRRNAERARQAARLYAPFTPSKALAAYETAVELDPTDAWSWIELGRLRLHYGSRLAEVRNCFLIALQHVESERDRMVLHNEFGDILLIEGELPEARAEYEAALAIDEKLAALEPGNTERQRDLSVSHNKLGDVEMAAGNLGAARRHYEEGFATIEKLAALERGNTEWQRDLSVSHDRLGDTEVAAGNLGAARRHYEKGLAIR
ncbi:MAG TPA: hypothetical protein VFW19_01460, partial [Allosphingosinicella sp.]|nr:hypothetical protein [Allosphingosinicella sp.]